jgi:biopolymer transport protein ExbB
MALIKTCVALCPLMGLMGTVTGMIEVFEVMAISGSGNPRSMASGVSKATVPTMAGMVAALSGVAMSAYMQGKLVRERALLGERMTMDH